MEKIILKARISRIQSAEPITTEADLQAVVWEDAPLTLRDDEIVIAEAEPQEDEVYSHENDAAEDVDFAGTGLKATGSFIKMSYDALVQWVGGEKSAVTGKFNHKAKKLMLNKALRYELRGGGEIIIPNAKGYVLTNLSVGFGGKSKFPFKFAALPASKDWDCDIIW